LSLHLNFQVVMDYLAYFLKNQSTRSIDKILCSCYSLCCSQGFGSNCKFIYVHRFRSSFICQGTSTRRQQSDLFSFRVKLPPVTTSL